jgi:ATP-binding cassette subfamily B protein
MAKAPVKESEEERRKRLAAEREAERRRREEEEDDEDEDDDDEDDEDDDEDDDDDDRAPHVLDAKETVNALTIMARFLKPFLPAHRKGLSLILLTILIETAYNTAFPLALKYLIDDAINGDDYEVLVWILATMAAMGIISSAAMIWFERLNAVTGASIIADIRTRLFDHAQTLSLGYYQRNKTGEVLQRFSSDISQIEETVNYGAQWGVLPLFELIAGLGLMFFLNWQLALVALLLLPIALIGPRLLAPRAVEASYAVKQREGSTLSVVQETVSSQQVVKAFNLQPIVRGWFRLRNHDIRTEMTRVTWYNGLVERSVTISVLALHLLVLGIGAYLAFNEQITVGTFVVFESVFWELSYNVGHITQFIPVLIEGSGAARHINDFLDEPSRNADKPDATELPRMQQSIAFENVTFSYDGEQQQLKGVSLNIPAGSRTAIVGPSGAGKSTIVSLILRLFDVEQGRVTVDGTDIAGVTRDSLRAHMAVVFQDNILFNISIRENIRLGNPGASDADVENAAKQAEIHKFIRGLPQGYDTIVGERGTLLSGGQRQRVAIARAIVRNPALLLLDEATSALDHSTEKAITRTLRKVSKGRTVISVTHRLTSVVDMDEIIVLDRGRIVETGKHADLMARKGRYFALWQDQLADDEDDDDDE